MIATKPTQNSADLSFNRPPNKGPHHLKNTSPSHAFRLKQPKPNDRSVANTPSLSIPPKFTKRPFFRSSHNPARGLLSRERATCTMPFPYWNGNFNEWETPASILPHPTTVSHRASSHHKHRIIVVIIETTSGRRNFPPLLITLIHVHIHIHINIRIRICIHPFGVQFGLHLS
ncbi:hypothetical protein VTN02DRAFT_3125 [Thermoascus thermophilus]